MLYNRLYNRSSVRYLHDNTVIFLFLISYLGETLYETSLHFPLENGFPFQSIFGTVGKVKGGREGGGGGLIRNGRIRSISIPLNCPPSRAK